MQKLRNHQPGSAPATLAIPSTPQGQKPAISLIEYDAHHLEERKIEEVENLADCLNNDQVSWIDITGLGDAEFLKQLGAYLRIHPLALQDMLNTGQRPKLDEFDEQFFVLLHMIYKDKDEELLVEQVSLLLGRNFVLTVQENRGKDVFDPVRRRIREGGGNLRFMKSDYLAYTLIDAVIDNYFPIVDSMVDFMEDLQEKLLDHPTREHLRELHDFRRTISQIRRSIWPQRDILGRLTRDESGLISKRSKPFYRDCHDHTVIILDLVENFREATTNAMDLYLSSISMRTNEVMRVLTIVITIFIPLTLIASIYGMNFDPKASPFNLPELELPYAYPTVLLVMLIIAVSMIVYFRRKKWL